jgi:hypothetical protein
VNLGAALGASFLVTLARPATWVLALAAFLVRGGIVLVLAPIVVIPSAVGMANVLGPWVTSFVFGGASLAILGVLAAIAAAGLVWLVGGGLLAAVAEAEATRIVARDEDVVTELAAAGVLPDGDRSAAGPGTAWRILLARLLAHMPTLLALSWTGARLVAVTYRELTLPSETLTPLVLRVVRGAPEALVVLLVTWVVGEMVGAMAARRVVLRDEGPLRSVVGALARTVRHPLRVAVLTLLPLIALVAVLVPAAAAASATWTATRTALATDAGFLSTFALLLAFVGLWAGGLALIALVAAWRAAVWTVDAVGTFGVSDPVRAGEWQEGEASGTLTDLRPRGVDPDPR